MMYKHTHWRWKNVLLSLVLLMMPVAMCAMEQQEEIKIDGMNLIEASRYGKKEVADSLIKAGAHINAVTNFGYTALIKASENGHKEIVDSLIKASAHINAVTNFGYTALMWASFRGHKKVVDSLIKEGADINAVNNYGYTALMWASIKGHKKVVDSLIKTGADINSVDHAGFTALMGASCYDYKEIVESLIKEGAHINAIDSDGWTALMKASCNSHKEVVDSLIKAGANPYIKNKKRNNSLDLVKNEELKKHIIRERNEYVIKKYKEYLIDGKNRIENLAALLQKEYDWYNPYWNEDKSEHDEHNLQEVKQSYSFPKDIAQYIARIRYEISDDEWQQMCKNGND